MNKLPLLKRLKFAWNGHLLSLPFIWDNDEKEYTVTWTDNENRQLEVFYCWLDYSGKINETENKPKHIKYKHISPFAATSWSTAGAISNCG